MKNPIVPVIIIIILLLIGGGFYFMKNKSMTPSANTMYNTNDKKQATGSKMMSMKDLLSSGQTQQCTYTYDAPTGAMKGTSYISSGKVRGDYTMSGADGKTIEGHMITDGKYIYNWSSAMPQGVKMEITEEMTQASDEIKNDPEKSQQYVDVNQQMNYDCKAWSADESVFTPPSDVTFVDYSAQINNMMKSISVSPGQNSDTSSQCQACANAPAESQAACKQALGCP